MKDFVVFIFYNICFISVSAGLKCYECDDVYPDRSTVCSSDPVVTVCSDEGSIFCVTITSKSEQGPYSNCGERSCVMRGCMSSVYCPRLGTFEVPGSYGNFTFNCCDGDLCNMFSLAHICKNNLFIYFVLFNLFCLLENVLQFEYLLTY